MTSKEAQIRGLVPNKSGYTIRTGTGYDELDLASRLRNDKDIPRTRNEFKNITTTTESIIEGLDEYCINEILRSGVNDIDIILTTITKEVEDVLYGGKVSIDKSSLQYVDTFSKSIDEYLKEQSLNYFITTVLPTFDTEWFHIEWANMTQMYRKLCIQASRGSGKSFFFSWALILWKMYRYRKPTQLSPIVPLEIQLCKEGILITNEFRLARKLLKKVRDEILDNDILCRKLRPEGIGGFGNDQLRTKTGAQVDISSFHSSNRGPHPGWIVVDDFLDKSALYSSEQRDKFWESFSAEITNMLLPNGSFNVVGTPFHEDDLYGRLKKDNTWKIFEYPAIFPNGSILSSRFPLKDLIPLRESLGSLIFTREYLVKPISEISTIFPYTILNNALINMQNLKLVDNINNYPVKFKKISVGCDWAISSSIGADYTVFTVFGLSTLDEYHLLHITRLQGSSHNEQINKLQWIRSNFNPDVIIAESNGFQKVMIQLCIESGIREIQPFITTSGNKKDLYDGVPSISVLFERGQLKIPYGDEHSKNMANIILSEFNAITFDDDSGKLENSGGHDDTAMAIFFSIRGMNQVNTQLRVSLI